jgi:hypothetical protein
MRSTRMAPRWYREVGELLYGETIYIYRVSASATTPRTGIVVAEDIQPSIAFSFKESRGIGHRSSSC